MDHWGVRHRALYIGQGEEHERRLPSDVPNEEESSDEEEEEEEEKVIKAKPVFMLENVCLLEDRKRKRPCLTGLREVKEESCAKPVGRKLKLKKHESIIWLSKACGRS